MATDFDNIELSIHEDAWRIVEGILDQHRRKVTLHANIGVDGMLNIQLPADVPPAEYEITILLEALRESE